MPTYEYVCEKCHHAFEMYQSMTAKPLTVCPQDKCGRAKWGKGKVKRLMGKGAGLIFKGSGFYCTDYRSDGYKSEQKKDSAAASPSSTAAAASSSTPSSDKSSSSKPQSTPSKTESKPSSAKPSAK
jgi:putative FmdB family regulatory protein